MTREKEGSWTAVDMRVELQSIILKGEKMQGDTTNWE